MLDGICNVRSILFLQDLSNVFLKSDHMFGALSCNENVHYWIFGSVGLFQMYIIIRV